MNTRARFRTRLYRIIFEHDTPAGKLFDIMLILAILSSVLVVMLDSVAAINRQYGRFLQAAEWFFTILFSIEYVLRLYSAPSAGRYALSFYGIVDFVAVIPTYLALIFPSGRFLITIRILRVLRIFRVLKLAHFVGEAGTLWQALKASRYKIAVFLSTVLAIVVIVGSVIYLVEGPAAGFTSIPRAMYWAIVTLTTVGYGDIAPQTTLGQFLAALLMILGYGIIAVPTGIVTVELGRASQTRRPGRVCPQCGQAGHSLDAVYCKYCGSAL